MKDALRDSQDSRVRSLTRRRSNKDDKMAKMLVGYFVLVYARDYSVYRTGDIIEQVSPGHYFVQFDPMNGGYSPMPLELVSEAEMVSLSNDGDRCWKFFKSRERRQKFLDWADTLPEPNVEVVRSITDVTH